jgi:ABC-type amino acid transport substrate-binding protein
MMWEMTGMKRIFTILWVTLILAAVFAACAAAGNSGPPAADSAENVKVITIGVISYDKPKTFVDADGKIKGYDVEVFEEIDQLWDDVAFEFEAVDQSAMLLGVETGKYGIATDGLFKNPSREEKFLFPKERLGYSPLNLVIKTDSDINSLEDMQGKTFSPLPANWGNYYILKTYIDAHPEGNYSLSTIDSLTEADAFKWIDEGRYDAYFGPPEALAPIKEELGLDLKLSDVALYEPTYPIFEKSNTELAARYDEAIKLLYENGTLSEISEKWLGTDVFADQQAFETQN